MILGLIPLAFALSTTPVTIHPTHHGGTMASQSGNTPGGGNNRQNKGRAGELTPRISYPIRHPNANPTLGTTRQRIGMDASHPIIEETKRPGQLR